MFNSCLIIIRNIHNALRRNNVYLQYASSVHNETKLTVHFTVSRKPSSVNRHIILSSVTLLYLLCFLQLIAVWYSLNFAVVNNGDTRDDVAFATLGVPEWITVIELCTFNFLFVVSDGLLVSGYSQ